MNIINCIQDKNGNHKMYFCMCKECKDYDRYEDAKDDARMEAYDVADEMEHD